MYSIRVYLTDFRPAPPAILICVTERQLTAIYRKYSLHTHVKSPTCHCFGKQHANTWRHRIHPYFPQPGYSYHGIAFMPTFKKRFCLSIPKHNFFLSWISFQIWEEQNVRPIIEKRSTQEGEIRKNAKPIRGALSKPKAKLYFPLDLITSMIHVNLMRLAL